MLFPLLYTLVTAAFGGAVLRLLLKQELNLGRETALGLLLLLLFEPLCYNVTPGYLGFCLFSLACLLAYWKLPTPGFLPVQEKAVLITGCDSGFGHALAKYLDELGFIVFAGVLFLDGPGAQDLKRCGSDRLTVLQMDVTNSQQISEVFEYVKAQLKDKGLWGIVNNAGILEVFAEAEILPMNAYKHCLEVNFLGAVEVTKVFLPLLRQAKGRLINVSSLAGSVPIMRFAPYNASKAALSIFSNTLRFELAIWGVKVAIIQPSLFKTGIFGTNDQRNRRYMELLQQLSPEVRKDYGESYLNSPKELYPAVQSRITENLQPVLKDIVNALLANNPRRLYTPGSGAFLIPLIYHNAPTFLSDFIIFKHFNKIPNIPDGAKPK
ncbi:17-beta-hydroxysteroid dehydrogenase type 2-like isoform X1 [Hypanus sabinus]|uniref:17-beta-hydroxysteroid dehydrogenase type 2-like isoform X1 n=1 Tax=Hypanus sabinus TaxID=79690 RepID=UPI0028C48E73|nr:17-beta-hydroxysteroid dehydrogenase type 2-like isoform X1 [Hypanus sabinus]